MQILSAPFSWLRRIFKPRAATLQEDSGATSVLNKELEQILESTTYSTTRKVFQHSASSMTSAELLLFLEGHKTGIATIPEALR